MSEFLAEKLTLKLINFETSIIIVKVYSNCSEKIELAK